MEGEYEVSNIAVRTMLLSHPGNCLGYRVQYNDRAICYITDNEMYNADSPFYNAHYVEKLTEFVCEADVLITDCTYTDEEYLSKIGWGHSSIGQVTDLAHNAEVKNLYLFHHDPDQTDADIDHKLETVAKSLEERGSKTKVVAPAEGQSFTI
jgi:phosphoribosyl 1,2-cyclic phosphodiesterase